MSDIRKGCPTGRKPIATRPTNVVPPAQYDRMRAPVWTANPAAPARAGALNHTRIESRGFRC